MTLRFIIGRAGMGKTRLCLSEITTQLNVDGEGPLIYLVPEQATFYTEKNLLAYSGLEGTLRAQVLSFQRLAWRVLQETGGGIYPCLKEEGKVLILRSILEKHRKSIRAFARVLDKPGFIRDLACILTEFQQYGVLPHRLEEVSTFKEQVGQELSTKMTDLSLVYREFQGAIERQFLDTHEPLDLLAKNLSRSGYLQGAQIWLDGFHGFTPQEMSIIRELMLKVKQVNVTLCVDQTCLKKRLTDTDLFYPTWETYQKLQALAQEIMCPIIPFEGCDDHEGHRFSACPELAFLEQSLRHSTEPFQGKNKAVKLIAAVNRRAELEGVARQIIRLGQGEGLRYQEMAVLIRNYEAYESLLPAVFAAAGIPFFIDRKRTLEYHPLLDLVQGALEVVEKGWTYDPLFRYLKTDLTPLSRQDIDLLENYCLAYGIRGSRWTDGQDWTFRQRLTLQEEQDISLLEQEELKRINRSKKKAAAALILLDKTLQAAKTARDMAIAVCALLEDLGIARKLEAWSQKAQAEGNLDEAQLHGQVWQQVLELLDQLVEALGDCEMDLPEFCRVLGEGLDSIELGLIPPALDQVLIGSVDRSRNPELKAAFILGVNDGVLPQRRMDSGLISDEERQDLAQLDIVLAPVSEQRQFSEQFLIYTALTSASHYLWVSYPLADEEGKALSPSMLIGRLETLFTQGDDSPLEVLALEPSGNDPEFVSHPHPTLGRLAVHLRLALDGVEVNPLWYSVYNWYLAREEWQTTLSQILCGLFPQVGQEHLNPGQVRRLYGSRLVTSISRLEKHRSCPFAHFLTYGLKLKERREFKLKSPELGQFFHAALEEFHRSVQTQGLEWSELSDFELAALVENIVEQLVPRLQNELLLSTARYRYLTRKLKRIILRAVTVLQQHEQKGTFRPLGVEMIFGPGQQLPGLTITLASGMEVVLQGRIDRVDKAQDQGQTYLRVIDFKSGTPSISLLEIFYGLKLQLLAYLDVILTDSPALVKSQALPGGAFYFRIKDPMINGEGPIAAEVIEKKILQQLKLQGYLLNEPEVIRLMDKELKGHSQLVPVGLKADESLYQNGEWALSQEEFSLVRQHVRKVFADISEEIMAGRVAVAPYRFKGRSPCKNCFYQAVCRFDAGIPGFEHRVLVDKENQELWQVMRGGDALDGSSTVDA